MTLDEMINRTGKRQTSFRMMIDHLKTVNNPLIVETGCARISGNWAGDGMSTVIFDQFINDYSGELHTIDINSTNLAMAQSLVSSRAQLHCADSVAFLWTLNKQFRQANRYIDLLYLDSYDYEPNNPYPSMVHHIKEMAAIIDRMRPGSMLAVDDNMGSGASRHGKPKYIAELMETFGIPLLHEGYQLVWKF
jgi:predicted O-methyltransferase YrrM